MESVSQLNKYMENFFPCLPAACRRLSTKHLYSTFFNSSSPP